MAFIVRWYWNFGDGYTSAQQSPVHTYRMAGVYYPFLTVTDSDGNSNTSYRKIVVRNWGDSLNVSRTNESFRYAVKTTHGIGFSENTGDDWVFPEARTGTIRIIDTDGQHHLLVLDNNDGLFYDISTRDGPSTTKYWKDKVATDGTSGTDVVPDVYLKEIRADREAKTVEHINTRINVRPIEESDGYDSGTELDTYIYVDGEPTTETCMAEDIPTDGNVYYDRVARGSRLQTRISANTGKIQIIGIEQMYKTNDIVRSSTYVHSTESDRQTNLSSNLVHWWSRGGDGLFVDKITGRVATGSITTLATMTGPDGRSNSAISMAGTTGILTLGAIDITSGSMILTRKTAGVFEARIDGVSFGSGDASFDLGSSWYLRYWRALTKDGILTLYVSDPSLPAGFFDIRIYSGDVSVNDITYLKNDLLYNSGDATLSIA